LTNEKAIYSPFNQCYMFNCIAADGSFACTFQDNVYHKTFVKVSRILEYNDSPHTVDKLRNDSTAQDHKVEGYKGTFMTL